MLPDKNSGYTVTLNVKDHEYIDFCAIAVDEQQGLLITTEQGFSEGTIESCRIVPNNRPEFVIRVTSSTAAPCERKIRFLQTATVDGRIIEIVD